jgi:hypothetical protein
MDDLAGKSAHVKDLMATQAAMALEFDLAIRDYVGKSIRPEMEKRVAPNEFVPEAMSTSFVARSIFQRVNARFPDYILKFSSENPRNPVNQAGPEEKRLLDYFRRHPEADRWTGPIRLEGKDYYGYFSPRRSDLSCLHCHGEPDNAPASLLERYDRDRAFHWPVGEVVALDTVAIPMDRFHSGL